MDESTSGSITLTEEEKYLLEKRQNINYQDDCEDFELLEDSSLDRVKLLLKKGADVNMQNLLGETPLITASRRGNYEVVKLLIENGAKVDLQKNAGLSALMSASENGHCEVAKLLIENGAKVDMQDNDRWSALISASKNGHCEVAKLLIQKGAKVNLNDRWSALMPASQNGHCDVAKLLIENGAKVDLQDKDGWSALMIASQNGHCKMAELLLEKGAKVDLLNNNGWSALKCANKNKHFDVVKLLYRNKDRFGDLVSANVNSQNEVPKPLMDNVHSDLQVANVPVLTLQLAMKNTMHMIKKELNKDQYESPYSSLTVSPSPVHNMSAVQPLHLTEALYAKTRIGLNSGIDTSLNIIISLIFSPPHS